MFDIAPPNSTPPLNQGSERQLHAGRTDEQAPSFTAPHTGQAGPEATRRSKYVVLIRQQLLHQRAVIEQLRSEGTPDSELQSLERTQHKLQRLAASPADRYSPEDAKPFFHRSASSYAKAFSAQARRLAGPSCSAALQFGLLRASDGEAVLALGNTRRKTTFNGNLEDTSLATQIGFIANNESASAAAKIAARAADLAASSGAADVAQIGTEVGSFAGFAAAPVKFAGSGMRLHGALQNRQMVKKAQQSLPELRRRLGDEDFRTLDQGLAYRRRLSETIAVSETVRLGANGATLAFTVASVAGFTAPFTVPVALAVGATGAVATQVTRVSRAHEKSFTGTRASTTVKEEHMASKDPMTLVRDLGYDAAMSSLAQQYRADRLQYVRLKLNSLIRSALKTEAEYPASEGEREQRLRDMIDPDGSRPGSKSWLRRTTARPQDIEVMNRLLDEEIDTGLLRGTADDVKNRLIASSFNVPHGNRLFGELLRKIDHKWLGELKSLKYDNVVQRFLDRDFDEFPLTVDDVHHLCRVSTAAAKTYEDVALKALTKQLKRDAAFSRTLLSGHITQLARTEMQHHISLDHDVDARTLTKARDDGDIQTTSL